MHYSEDEMFDSESPRMCEKKSTTSLCCEEQPECSSSFPTAQNLSLIAKSISCPGQLSKLPEIYNDYTKCKHCGLNSLEVVRDYDGSILLKQCADCGYAFGMDDGMCEEDVVNVLRGGNFGVTMGCCENSDPERFRILNLSEDGLLVECMECRKKTLLNNGTESLSGTFEGIMLDDALASEPLDDSDECTVKDEAFASVMSINEMPLNLEEYVSCKCKRWQRNINVSRGSNGQVEMVGCGRCQAYYSLPMNIDDSKVKENILQDQGSFPQLPSCRKDSYLERTDDTVGKCSGKHRVYSLNGLIIGDHICWDRPEGYYHHAIVCNVDHVKKSVSVIHYNGPSPHDMKNIKGMILCEDLAPMEKKYGDLYKVDYSKCSPPEVVLQRAKSRLDEKNYSLALNNCEHFAHWCKTGHEESSQVNSVLHHVKGVVQEHTSRHMKKVLGQAAAGFVVKALPAKALGIGSMATVIGLEIFRIHRDIQDLNERRLPEKIDRPTYVKLVVRTVTQGVGGASGMMAGALLGNKLIPVVGGVIGGTLGRLLGQVVGRYSGGQLGHLAQDQTKICEKYMS